MHKCADTPPTLAEAFLVVISSTSSSPLLPPSLTPHSTPSSVTPSSSSVMLDRLPTELLLRILKLAAPLDYSPSFYHERCDLLLACSLVSKQLCTVAQPMLPEVYVVTGKEQVEILEADVSGKKGSKVKLLVLDGSYLEENICDLIDVPDLLALCAGTVEVRVREAGEFNLDWLSGNLGTLISITFKLRTDDNSHCSTAFPRPLRRAHPPRLNPCHNPPLPRRVVHVRHLACKRRL